MCNPEESFLGRSIGHFVKGRVSAAAYTAIKGDFSRQAQAYLPLFVPPHVLAEPRSMSRVPAPPG